MLAQLNSLLAALLRFSLYNCFWYVRVVSLADLGGVGSAHGELLFDSAHDLLSGDVWVHASNVTVDSLRSIFFSALLLLLDATV